MPAELAELKAIVMQRLDVVDVAGDAVVKLVGDGVEVRFDIRDSMDGNGMYDMVKLTSPCALLVPVCVYPNTHSLEYPELHRATLKRQKAKKKRTRAVLYLSSQT
jgi:hypothetical protein